MRNKQTAWCCLTPKFFAELFVSAMRVFAIEVFLGTNCVCATNSRSNEVTCFAELCDLEYRESRIERKQQTLTSLRLVCDSRAIFRIVVGGHLEVGWGFRWTHANYTFLCVCRSSMKQRINRSTAKYCLTIWSMNWIVRKAYGCAVDQLGYRWILFCVVMFRL